MAASVEATVLSWPDATNAYWVPKAFWHIALDLAFQSVASSLCLICLQESFEHPAMRVVFDRPTMAVVVMVYPYYSLYYSCVLFTLGHLMYTVAPLWDTFRRNGEQKVRAFTFWCYSTDIYVLQGAILYVICIGSVLCSASVVALWLAVRIEKAARASVSERSA